MHSMKQRPGRRPARNHHGAAMRLSQRSIVIIPGRDIQVGNRQSVPRVAPILAVSTARFNTVIFQQGRPSMTARIFNPAKNAMQSGKAQTREWQLEYEPEQPRAVEPLMGWTSSSDMKQQVTLHFDSKEEAVAYCERKGIPYQV